MRVGTSRNPTTLWRFGPTRSGTLWYELLWTRCESSGLASPPGFLFLVARFSIHLEDAQTVRGSLWISIASSSRFCDAQYTAGVSQWWGFETSDALGRPPSLAAGWPSRMSKARLKAAAPWRELRLRTPGLLPAPLVSNGGDYGPER